MKALLTIFLAVVILSSCATQKRCFEKFPVTVDTTVVTIVHDSLVVKDTTIFVHLPGEVVYDTVKIPCDAQPKPYKVDTAWAKSEYSEAYAFWRYPYIHLVLTQKDTIISFKIDSAITAAYYWEAKYNTILQTQTVVKKEIPIIYRIALWSLVVLIFVLILLLLIRRL